MAGDVILLGPGDVVPADARVVEAAGLEVDESSLTGESLPVAKSPSPVAAAAVADRTSMVYEGTTVAAGRATVVVTAVGTATEAGRSMATAWGVATRSGVEARLAGITRVTMPVALAPPVAVVAAGLLRAVPLRDTVSAGVALAVASVPEGLPLLVGARAACRRPAAGTAGLTGPQSPHHRGAGTGGCPLLRQDRHPDRGGDPADRGLGRNPVSSRRQELDDRLRAVVATALRATPRGRARQPWASLTDRAVARRGPGTADRTQRRAGRLGADGDPAVRAQPWLPRNAGHGGHGDAAVREGRPRGSTAAVYGPADG